MVKAVNGREFGNAAFSACKDSRDRTDVVTNISMNWVSRTC